MWTPMTFGRYEGKTLPTIMFRDPDWAFWAIEQDCFDYSFRSEVAEMNRRARCIRLPEAADAAVAIYTTENGKFAGLQIVPTTIVLDGGSPVHIGRHIDLSFPRFLCEYDKGGGRILIRDLKCYLFHNPHFRMTEARAGAFFDNDANFCLDDDCPACLQAGIGANQCRAFGP